MRYFCSRGLAQRELPLLARREAAAAAPAQAALLDRRADLLARLRADRLQERRVAAARDVLLDARRVDDPAVLQHPPQLRLEERVLVDDTPSSPTPAVVAELAELPEQVLLRRDSRRGPRRRCAATFSSVTCWKETRLRPGKLDVEDGLERAEADAADLDDLGVDALRGEVRPERFERLRDAGAQPARAGPDVDDGLRDVVAAQPREVLAVRRRLSRRRPTSGIRGRCRPR